MVLILVSILLLTLLLHLLSPGGQFGGSLLKY